MMASDIAPPRNIAVSISESPDMAMLGFSEDHLREAMADFAIQLLASGATLAYGGDLRMHGFTELLFDLVLRYRRSNDATPRVVNYLAWPVHAAMTTDRIESLVGELVGYADLVLVTPEGDSMPATAHRAVSKERVDDDQWDIGLTAMRQLMQKETDARIVMGGRVEGYKGTMPGIAEEALLSLQGRQPLYVVGGFGGCARDIAETLGLSERWSGSQRLWSRRREFESYTGHSLKNGLVPAENRLLAETPHIEQAIMLTMTGLRRLRN